MYVLFTDTDNDVTPSIAKEYGYNLISMPYTVNDVDVFPYEDFTVFEHEKYYESLRNGVVPKTMSVNYQRYIEYFEPFFKEGKDILYVHFSEALSGTFSVMSKALEELKEKYPERKFYSIDTKGISLLGLVIVREIGEMYLAGKSAEEIVKWANDNVLNYSMLLYADDLKFFAKSGRISNFSAIMGSLIGLHPIIYLDNDGKMVSLCKCRGKKGSLSRIIEIVEETNDDIANNKVIVGHSGDEETAKVFAEKLKEKFGIKDIEIVVVNPTAGAHCGPNCVGLAFRCKHR